MQSRIQKDKREHDPTTCHSRQDIREPLIVPGKFSCEPVNDECQHKTDRTSEKYQYTRNVVSGLVELAEIPSVSHQDQRCNTDLQKRDYFPHYFMLNVYGSKREDAVVKSFR
jgi:hypothetical protein